MVKGTINKTKREPSECKKKKNSNNATDNGLIFKIYEQLMELNIKKKPQPTQLKNGQKP